MFCWMENSFSIEIKPERVHVFCMKSLAQNQKDYFLQITLKNTSNHHRHHPSVHFSAIQSNVSVSQSYVIWIIIQTI